MRRILHGLLHGALVRAPPTQDVQHINVLPMPTARRDSRRPASVTWVHTHTRVCASKDEQALSSLLYRWATGMHQ
ncbi:hypothetical protein DFH06DRAFT_1232392 [Mycena polygramma]|nr:hypothetical protein DFH06DRAFT_1232392 [Mycena polygramma]